jgi:hypothetical protein
MAWWTEIKTAYNSTFAICGVSCSADSFVVASKFVVKSPQIAKM